MWVSKFQFVAFLLCTFVGMAQEPVAKEGQHLQTIPIDEEFVSKSRIFYTLIPRVPIDTPEILFTCTELDWGDYIADPSILTFRDQTWTRFSVPAPSYDWVWAGSSKDSRYVWGVLDNVPEGPAHELMFVMSEDSGRTWKVGRSFKKYRYTSIFNDFRMDKDGNGKIVIWYPDDDVGLPDSEVGYHSYSTNDWGRTWTDELTYEPDFVDHAMDDFRRSSEKQEVIRGMESAEQRAESNSRILERKKSEQGKKNANLDGYKAP